MDLNQKKDKKLTQADAAIALLAGGAVRLHLAVGDVRAAESGVAGEAWLAEALVQVSARDALGVLAAHAGDGARVHALVVHARLVSRALVVAEALEGDAAGQGVAGGAGRAGTDSLVVDRLALRADAAGTRDFARVAALGLETGGGVRALAVVEAVSGVAAARHHGVAHLALRTHARVAAQGVAAEAGAVARGVTAFVHIHAASGGVCLEASLAVAHGSVVYRLAPSEATVHTVTRVCRRQGKK